MTTFATPDTGRDARPGLGPALETLRLAVPGAVHVRGDLGYDDLVTAWNLAATLAPAAVVAPRRAEDVALTIRIAGAHGLTVGVQATGHGAQGATGPDVLVCTRHLDELTVHPAQAWARVGAGVRWASVLEAAARHGLQPVMGSSSDVGVVGFLTGGGVGPFARTDGLAADRVRAFEVVTGDGVLRRVTPTEHPRLFRTLRGGKAAAGVVTAVEIDLMTRSSFYGGALYLDGTDAPRVLHAWREWCAELPETGTTSIALMRLPDLPDVPPPLAGRLTVSLRFAWTGDPAEGERWLEPMRRLAPVLVDDVAVKPVTAQDSVHADPVDPMPVVESAFLIEELTADGLETILRLTGPGSSSTQVMVEVRQLGGALARPGLHPSAFDHRAAAFSVLAVGIAMDPAVRGHARDLHAAMARWDTGGVWPNFEQAHDLASARRVYSEGTLRELAAVATTYDPGSVLAGGRFLLEVPTAATGPAASEAS